MSCLNISHPDFQKLLKETNIPSDLLAGIVNELVNSGQATLFPTAKQIKDYLNKGNVIKENPQQAKKSILKKVNANAKGFINPQRYGEVLKLVGDYNKSMGYKALALKQAIPAPGKQLGDYYITVEAPQFQLESLEKKGPNQTLNNLLESWAINNGIAIEDIRELSKRFSSIGDVFEGAAGVAMMLDKIIGIDPTKEKLDTMAEEVAHFAIAFMSKDPSVKKALDTVVNTEEYTTVKEDYKNVYTKESQFRKEALGKILAKVIVTNFQENNNNKGILAYLKAIFNRFWRKISSIKKDQKAVDSIKKEMLPIAESILKGETIEDAIVEDSTNYFQLTEDYSYPGGVGEEADKKQKITFLNKAVEQMENRLADLLKQSKSKKATEFLALQTKTLKDKINKSQFDAAVLNVLQTASAELKQLENIFEKYKNNNKLLPADISNMIENFTIMYSVLFNDFGNELKNQTLEGIESIENFNLKFEIEEIQKRINNINTENRKHIKQIRINALKRANTDAAGNIIDPDFDPEAEDVIVDEDASWWRFYVGNYKFAKSSVIRAVHKLISDSIKKVRRYAVGVSNELLQAQAELEAAGYKVEDLVELGENGVPSQYLIREKDYSGYFEKLRKVQESLAKTLGAEDFSEINKASLSPSELKVYKETFEKFFDENTIKVKDSNGNTIVMPKAENPRFKELMKVPAVKNYYDLLLSKIKEATDKLPAEYRTESAYYKIPGIRKQFLERMTTQNKSFLEKIKDVTTEGFKEVVSRDEDDTQFGDLRQLNNRVIPIFFTRRLSDPNNLSLDLTRSVTIFAEMAENFKQMNVLGPELLTVQKGIAETKYRKGKIKPTTVSGSQSIDYKILDVLIDQYVYGVAKKDIEIKIGNKIFSASKIVDKLTNYIRTNNLAMNLITSVSGYLKGSIDSIIEDQVGIYSTNESKQWARIEYIKNLAEVSTEILSHQKNNKMHLLLQLGNVVELSKTLKNTNKSKFISEAISKDMLFLNYKTVDYAIKGRVTLSILDNNRLYNGNFVNKLEFTKLKEKEGVDKKVIDSEWSKLRDKSFYNAFEVVNKKLQVKPEFSQYVTEGIQNKIFSQVEHVTNLVDGTISETDKGALSRTVAGDFPLMHRGWFINLIDTRFKKERVVYTTGQTEIGIYNATFGKLIWQNYLVDGIWNQKNPLAFMQAWANLNDVEKRAAKKAGLDFLFLTLISILSGLVNIAADDDKEDFTMQLLAYQMNRLLLEQKSSWSMQETLEMIDEPVVGVKTIKDLLDITEAFNFGEVYERGMYEDQSHAAKWWTKKIPAYKNLYELQFPDQKNNFIKQVLDSPIYNTMKKDEEGESSWFSLGHITGLNVLKNAFKDKEVTVDEVKEVEDTYNAY